ncbi:MAG: ABC transporter substrate-binding protein [Firmicutes bacterium]|nr:ABC transporter substrate-binding protein [Bacillota bacterium]
MSKLSSRKKIMLLKKIFPVIFAAVLIIAVAVSSVDFYKEEVLNIDPDMEYSEQDTVYLSSERIDTLNPVISQSQDVYYLSKLIYSSLFTYDENLNLKPELAGEYEINTEKAYINITLKEDVLFHDGEELRASDVAFTINAMKAAGTECPYYDKIKKINSAFARSKYVVTIYFNNNYNCSLDDLVFPVLNDGDYRAANQLVYDKDDFIPVGTGQYKYKSYNSTKQLRLVPYKDYFASAAKKNIIVTILPDRELASNMMEIDSVSCYVDSGSDRKSIASDRNLKVYDFPSNDVEFIVFNTNALYMSSKEVRHAVAYGININKILENSYMGDGILTDTIYYPNFLGVKDTLDYYEYSMPEAMSLLASVGFSDKNTDGFLEDAAGETINFTILVNNDNATRNSAARNIKADLEQLGLKSTISSLSGDEYLNAIQNRSFDILITGYTIGEEYDLRNFFNGKSEWKYYNYELFELSRELDRLYTPQQYAEKYQELKTKMMDELPYYPVCYKKMSLIGLPSFEADKLPMFNNIYKNCSSWKWSIVSEKNNDEN